MADIKFLFGLNANKDSVNIVDGQLLFTTDTKRLFLDMGSQRIEMYGDIVSQVATLVSDMTQAKTDIIAAKKAGDDAQKDATKALQDAEAAQTAADNAQDDIDELNGIIEGLLEDTDFTDLADLLEELMKATGVGSEDSDTDGSLATRLAAVEAKLEGISTTVTAYVTAEINKIKGDTTSTIKDAMDAATAASNLAGQKVASVAAGDGIEVTGTGTAPVVGIKIADGSEDILSVDENGLAIELPSATDYTVSIDSSSTTAGSKATYDIKQLGASKGKIEIPQLTLTKDASGNTYTLSYGGTALETKIEIPKDLVVKSGKIVESNGTTSGTFIELTLNDDSETKIYIDVKTLVDVYEAGEDTSSIHVTVASNKITANVKDNGIVANMIAADAVTTAKILDANVTAGKLATDAVETAKIKDANVTAAKLATDAVETAKIKNEAVTEDKLSSALKIKINNASAGLVWANFTDAATQSAPNNYPGPEYMA